MKIMIGVFAITMLILSCGTDYSKDIKSQQIEIKDYSRFGDSNDYDSLQKRVDCIEGDDSLLEKRVKELQDSTIEIYDQFILRMEKLSTNKTFKQQATPFLESLNNSKQACLLQFKSDPDIVFYSFGGASGSKIEATCYKIRMMEDRLLLLKGAFSNAYWNYDFDAIK